MKPNKTNHSQGRLFQGWLSLNLNSNHELALLSKSIDWEYFEKVFSNLFSEKKGAPGKPIRLVVGLFMLQHMYGLSDEKIVRQWVENPYWQLFCGYDYLQWKSPIDASSLSNWRNRLGVKGLEEILKNTIELAVRIGVVKKKSKKSHC